MRRSSKAVVTASLALAFHAAVSAQTDALLMEGFGVAAPRVANLGPATTFSTPVSGLTFEPRVDVQARNFAEGQADIALRGGTFESTGLRVGALSLFDPQTGHYLMEQPIAPAMLGAPDVITGAANAAAGWNATAGSVVYGWRPIRSGGVVALGAGDFDLHREELYAGQVAGGTLAGRTLAADVAVAHSEANGSVPNGDHSFDRYNARLQLSGNGSQTDLFAGYQTKFFGWPNLYTPFNSPESEDIQTTLVALSHRERIGPVEDFIELGAYYRRNDDDYAFNRFAPVGPVHPFQHTTWIYGASLDGRVTLSDTLAVRYKAGVIDDALRSTSLTAGRFRSRTATTAGVFPEKTVALAGGRTLAVTTGATYDNTNRDASALSPLLEIALARPASPLRRVYVSYAKATGVPTYTALNAAAGAGLFRGNPDLGRSASHNFEAGVHGAWAGWRGEAAVFFRRDDDLVDWTFRRGVTARSANAVDVDTTGVELFARRSFGKMEVILGYAWLAKDADYGSAAIDASFYALNFPKHRLTAALIAPLAAGLELRLDNEARIQEENFLRQAGGDEAVLTAVGLYYRVRLVPGLVLSVQVDNVWNSGFQEVPAVPAARRQFAVGMSYAW